jgi:hypothetical protein
MVGPSPPPPLVCRGFIETETFEQSKADLRRLHGLTDRDVDDRLEALIWALARGGDPALVQRIPTRRSLWVAVTPGGIPPLRIYLRPSDDAEGECDLLWIEEKV